MGMWWCEMFGGGSICASALQHAFTSHIRPITSPYTLATDCITIAACINSPVNAGDCALMVNASGVFVATTHALRLHARKESSRGGTQGPPGACTYICMYPNTDQENVVLTTLHI